MLFRLLVVSFAFLASATATLWAASYLGYPLVPHVTHRSGDTVSETFFWFYRGHFYFQRILQRASDELPGWESRITTAPTQIVISSLCCEDAPTFHIQFGGI